MANPKLPAAAATAKAKKEKEVITKNKDEVMLQELQKIRKTFVDVSSQVSKDLVVVMAHVA